MLNDTYFNNLYNILVAQAERYPFNLRDLPDFTLYIDGIREVDKFKYMFSHLDAKTTSCIYWFELSNEDNCSELIKLLDKNRKLLKKSVRVVPVQNKNCDSKTLYVGIRRGGFTKKWGLSNISARVIQHLGLYKVGSTQGLQLAHWTNKADYEITLNVFQFEEGFPNEYLGAIEKIMAHKLKPLCGKH